MSDDFEEDTTAPSDGQLRTIAGLLRQVPVMEKKVAEAEEAAKAARSALLHLTDVTLPEALAAAGYSAPTKALIGGMEIKFASYVNASITEEQRPAAHKWLRENGHGDLIKRETKFVFPRGSETLHKKFMAAFSKLVKPAKVQVKVSDKESVHASTLKAFVKEEIAQGREVPTGLFGVLVGKHVDVKPAAAAPAI